MEVFLNIVRDLLTSLFSNEKLSFLNKVLGGVFGLFKSCVILIVFYPAIVTLYLYHNADIASDHKDRVELVVKNIEEGEFYNFVQKIKFIDNNSNNLLTSDIKKKSDHYVKYNFNDINSIFNKKDDNTGPSYVSDVQKSIFLKIIPQLIDYVYSKSSYFHSDYKIISLD
ncbi:MAG TPA: hypothetical protein QKA14_00805 [Candidatus Megaira endosymbiont of Hartmannula sinica]|nr:hypothetical protein [Candidatus Megaera endosymbiont of Hartmannula sinica]